MLLMRFPGGKKKAFTMGYDDGQLHDRRMVEILNKHQIKCTFFPILSNFKAEADDGCITFDEAKTLYDGHEIGSHTIAHGFMGYTHSCQSMRDIMDDKIKGEQLFDRIIYGFGYPNGCYNEDTKKFWNVPDINMQETQEALTGLSFRRTGWSGRQPAYTTIRN